MTAGAAMAPAHHPHHRRLELTIPAAQSSMADTLMGLRLPDAIVVRSCDRITADLVECQWTPVSYTFPASGWPTTNVGPAITVYASRVSKECVFSWTSTGSVAGKSCAGPPQPPTFVQKQDRR